VATVKLDRKAKSAVWLVAILFLGIIILAIRQAVVTVMPQTIVATQAPETEDELIVIGGHSLLLNHGSVGNRIAHWAHAGSRDSRAFEVGDQCFTPASDDLTSEGSRSADTFAQLMNAAPAVNARIFASAYGNNPQLTEHRMGRLREALIRRGIKATRISVSAEPIAGGAALAAHRPEVVLVLS